MDDDDYEPTQFNATRMALALGSHPSHDFTGIDGRCYDCDVRPGGTASKTPCPVSRTPLAGGTETVWHA